MKVNKIIREIREEHEYSQEYIANKLEITQQTYSLYELGKSEIPLHHIYNLAELYNVSIDYLVGRNVTKDERLISEKTEYKIITRFRKLSKRKKGIFIIFLDFISKYDI